MQVYFTIITNKIHNSVYKTKKSAVIHQTLFPRRGWGPGDNTEEYVDLGIQRIVNWVRLHMIIIDE